MVFGGEVGLKNPKVVGLPALWSEFPIKARVRDFRDDQPCYSGLYGVCDFAWLPQELCSRSFFIHVI